jgi:hypothetical protein
MAQAATHREEFLAHCYLCFINEHPEKNEIATDMFVDTKLFTRIHKATTRIGPSCNQLNFSYSREVMPMEAVTIEKDLGVYVNNTIEKAVCVLVDTFT